MKLFRELFSMTPLIPILLLALLLTGGSIGYQVGRLETNDLKRNLAQMSESQELWKTLASRYQTDFQTTQVAFRLLPDEQPSPMTQAILNSCSANCGHLRVVNTASRGITVAINTMKDNCSTIQMPEGVFVLEPRTSNVVVIGTSQASVCMAAVVFATHDPLQ